MGGKCEYALDKARMEELEGRRLLLPLCITGATAAMTVEVGLWKNEQYVQSWYLGVAEDPAANQYDRIPDDMVTCTNTGGKGVQRRIIHLNCKYSNLRSDTYGKSQICALVSKILLR